MSLSPGELSLGLAAPVAIDGNRNESTLFVVYVLNSGGYLSKNTNVTLTLPEGLRTDSGKLTVSLGNMEPGESKQVAFNVRPDSLFKSKNAVISVSVDSDNLEPNQLKRAVELLGPPELEVSLSHAKSVTAGPVSYLDVVVDVYNPSDRYVKSLDFQLDLPESLTLPAFELSKKSFDVLKPKERKTLNWTVGVSTNGSVQRAMNLLYQSPIIPTQTVQSSVKVEALSSSLSIDISDASVRVGDFFYVDIQAFVPQAFRTGQLRLRFPDGRCRFIRRSIHPSFFQDNYASNFRDEDGDYTVQNLTYLEGAFLGSLLKYHFQAMVAGPLAIQFENDGEFYYGKNCNH